MPIIASVIGVLQIKDHCCNTKLSEITDDLPQSRPHRQPVASAARAASLLVNDTRLPCDKGCFRDLLATSALARGCRGGGD